MKKFLPDLIAIPRHSCHGLRQKCIAEALLTPAQQDALARCALEDAPLPSPLSEAQRVFCFGLSVLCEYEQRDEIFRYLL